MRGLLTHWHFYVFGIFCCSISHSTSHAPIFYAKKMIARRLRRFFEVNLFYSLRAGSEKAPPAARWATRRGFTHWRPFVVHRRASDACFHWQYADQDPAVKKAHPVSEARSPEQLAE